VVSKLLWYSPPQQKEHATQFQAKGLEDEERWYSVPDMREPEGCMLEGQLGALCTDQHSCPPAEGSFRDECDNTPKPLVIEDYSTMCIKQKKVARCFPVTV
jgi:hypothetical protein